MSERSRPRADTRARIIAAAVHLLHEHGLEALSTRAISSAADVQPPAIYRLFGDKDGLLNAVAEDLLASHVAEKKDGVRELSAQGADPLTILRYLWRALLDFGLSEPHAFHIVSDPQRILHSPAAVAGQHLLRGQYRKLVAEGRLRVREQLAADLFLAGAVGTVQTILSRDPENLDDDFAETMFDALVCQALESAPQKRANREKSALIALDAAADQSGLLSKAEHQLLNEWLQRTAS